MGKSNDGIALKKNKIKNEKSGRGASDIYKKMDPHEHILKLPDTYVGSVTSDQTEMWVLREGKIVRETITYAPGLYKIFDEIVVNARDHSVRDKSCREIRIDIDPENNRISVENTGQGIPIEIHQDEKVYIPEMIFGHLLTSSNYEEKGKTVGGKNGYGAKLANVFSTEFVVETAHSKQKKKYYQKFSNNMYSVGKPEISDLKGKRSFTRITFTPDLARFGLTELGDGMVALFQRRAYDVAASTHNRVKVYLNGQKLDVVDFRSYIEMFYDMADEENRPMIVYEEPNARWRIGVVYDPSRGYTHVSSVNGIFTSLGGTHVMHVVDQIIGGLKKYIAVKHKDLHVTPAYIKNSLTVFIDAVIEDPSFTSQTKEYLTNKYSSFGSRCDLSPKFLEAVIKSGVVDEAVKFAQLKAMATLKKTDGKKTGSVSGIPKLEDANWAGGRKSKQTRLILTEGDSAKAFAMSGLEIVGRDKYGVFPLRGKMLNVREATAAQLGSNAEIQYLKKILGLKQNKKYTDVSELRYGGIIILTDQDVDGSHIKGLVINMLHYFWPSLLKIDGFVQSMITPIVKVFKDSDKKMAKPLASFYTLTDCRNWSKGKNMSKYKFKYYKGLGTSRPAEAKEAFNELEQNMITYCWELNGAHAKLEQLVDDSDALSQISSDTKATDGDEPMEDDFWDREAETTKSIVLAFDKRYANNRKTWLGQYDSDRVINLRECENVSFTDFVNKDLIHFSYYDNIRSIPSICDGFKPSQRKILYASFLRKLTKGEIKVAQLAGFVSDRAQYHHGEVSLQGAIVNMAQCFVGANNIHVLYPSGEFGTRILGGKDAASARYIFTRLCDVTTKIFREEDACVLEHVVDDGEKIEPVTYCPILPMVLVNGAEGIGTGYSTSVPQFDPREIVKVLKQMLTGKDPTPLYPWYYGFTGKMDRLNHAVFRCSGSYEVVSPTDVRITELPIGYWTENFKKWLEAEVQRDGSMIEKIVANNCGTNTIDFTVRCEPRELREMRKSGKMMKFFKLERNIGLTNMVLHADGGGLKKYESVEEIFRDFYSYRLQKYVDRKKYYIDLLTNQMLILKYKMKFIEYIIKKKIIIEKRKKDQIIADLEKYKFPRLAYELYAPEEKKSYQYLVTMNLFALTQEKIEELREELRKKTDELEIYRKTPEEVLWERDLDEFLVSYGKFIADRADYFGKKPKTKKKKSVKKSRAR